METPSIRTLPDEVLALIFSHLSQGEILRSVLPVCRRWQAVAQSQVLSRGLVFSRDDAPTEEAVRLIQAIPNLKSLKLQRRPDTVQLLQTVGSFCTELRRLRVEVCRNEDSALTAALGSVFRSCSEHLTDLTLASVYIADGARLLCTALPNLRQLTIICCEWFGLAELDAVIDSCPQMEEFCTDCRCSDANISRLVQRWDSSVQVLDLTASELTDTGVAALAGCSQLRSLQLYNVTSPGAGLQQLATLGQLEQLELCWCKTVGSQNICDFFSRSRSAGRLRKIKLTGCREVDDGVLSALAAACPSVEDVSLDDCKRVTAAGVRELLRGCRRLLRLDVSGTDRSVAQAVRELPQLAPQLRRLNINAYLLSPVAVSGSVRAQMPDLNITESFP